MLRSWVFGANDVRRRGRQSSASEVGETFVEVVLLSKLDPTLASGWERRKARSAARRTEESRDGVRSTGRTQTRNDRRTLAGAKAGIRRIRKEGRSFEIREPCEKGVTRSWRGVQRLG